MTSTTDGSRPSARSAAQCSRGRTTRPDAQTVNPYGTGHGHRSKNNDEAALELEGMTARGIDCHDELDGSHRCVRIAAGTTTSRPTTPRRHGSDERQGSRYGSGTCPSCAVAATVNAGQLEG